VIVYWGTASMLSPLSKYWRGRPPHPPKLPPMAVDLINVAKPLSGLECVSWFNTHCLPFCNPGIPRSQISGSQPFSPIQNPEIGIVPILGFLD